MGTKRKVFIPLAITIILLAAFAGAWYWMSRNDYVLKVNGQKVSMTEFTTYFKLQKNSMESEASLRGEQIIWDKSMEDNVPVIEIARDGAKQSIIDTIVKTQQAKSRKLSLTTEEKESIRQLAEQLWEPLDKLGVAVEEYAKMYEDAILIDKLAIALYKEQDHTSHSHGNIDVVNLEAGKQPNITFNSRHILLNTEGLTEQSEIDAVKQKAEGILKRIKNGEDFATLAKQYSEDPGSKDNGGYYENIGIGSFVSEYEDAVFSIGTGEVYPTLVETSYGYHIIKSEGINNPNNYLRMNDAYEVLAEELNAEAEQWISNAKVEVNEQRYNSAQ